MAGWFLYLSHMFHFFKTRFPHDSLYSVYLSHTDHMTPKEHSCRNPDKKTFQASAGGRESWVDCGRSSPRGRQRALWVQGQEISAMFRGWPWLRREGWAGSPELGAGPWLRREGWAGPGCWLGVDRRSTVEWFQFSLRLLAISFYKKYFLQTKSKLVTPLEKSIWKGGGDM